MGKPTNLLSAILDALPLGIRSYPEAVGVTAGEILYLCVEPEKTFSVAFYFQGLTENLSPAPTPVPLVQDLRWVSRNGAIFTSFSVASSQKPDLDWNWPRIGFAIPSTWPSGVYFAIVYPVDPQTGLATDDLGTAVQTGDPQHKLKPHPDLSVTPAVAWDHGMALFVVRPTPAQASSGTVKIAYMLSVSTYQAYNNTGPGCFYYDTTSVTRVTLRRPGGGVGSPIMEAEADFLDTASMRGTYAHWDAKFIRWLARQNIACHFYTNYDLDGFLPGQPNPLISNAGQPVYPLLLSVGHDEYWSAAIRAAITAYQRQNGNVAIFSGNTCYRPVSFGAPSTSTSKYDPPPTSIPADKKSIIIKLADKWPDDNNEARTIGVTWRNGLGSWSPTFRRSNTGYTWQNDWIIQGGRDFGAALCVVGYEADGKFPGQSPSNYTVIADASFPGGDPWDIPGQGSYGQAHMGYFQLNTAAPAGKSTLFNAATTDWSRLLPLTDSVTDPDMLFVQTVTQAIINYLAS